MNKYFIQEEASHEHSVGYKLPMKFLSEASNEYRWEGEPICDKKDPPPPINTYGLQYDTIHGCIVGDEVSMGGLRLISHTFRIYPQDGILSGNYLFINLKFSYTGW